MKPILLCLALCACGRDVAMPTDPARFTVPANAVQFSPATREREALDSVRACILSTGHTANLTLRVDDLAWYTVPDSAIEIGTGRVGGIAGPTFVVLSALVVADEPYRFLLTKHELAHELTGDMAHESAFWKACGL